MNERQQWILDFIRRYHEDAGYMPSVREIQRGCEISSPSVVQYNLNVLERDGHLRRSHDIARSIQLVERAHHLTWRDDEWIDERCGCRYHPDDDNGTHSGGPHIHPCAEHAREGN